MFAEVIWKENQSTNTTLHFFCSRTHLQSEEIVAEMVYDFLIPEAEKMSIREKGKESSNFVLFVNRFTLLTLAHWKERRSAKSCPISLRLLFCTLQVES